jgi:hypothetical protein
MELTTIDKRRAGTAFEYTLRDYTREGGLHDLEQKVEAATTKCSSYIFSLAQFASRQKKNIATATEHFSELCLYAETSYKTKNNVENLKDVLPVWSVYKSNILRGMRAGFDPAEYGSEGAFRNVGEPSERSSVPATTPAKPNQTVTIETAGDLFGTTSIRSSMQMLLARLVVEAEFVRKGREKEAEQIVQKCVADLNALVDKRRIKDAATKAALGEAA